MNDDHGLGYPETYELIRETTAASGFTMASDPLTGALLRTLAGTKPGGRLLELGTGTGLSTAWILSGMNGGASLISVDNDASFQGIAKQYLGQDSRLQLVCADGEHWVKNNHDQRFDFIFADTWHGKYLLLEEVLDMLNAGGIYLIDDMLPQPNWPEGHAEKAERLLEFLDQHEDLLVTKLNWSTGLVIAVKRSS